MIVCLALISQECQDILACTLLWHNDHMPESHRSYIPQDHIHHLPPNFLQLDPGQLKRTASMTWRDHNIEQGLELLRENHSVVKELRHVIRAGESFSSAHQINRGAALAYVLIWEGLPGTTEAPESHPTVYADALSQLLNTRKAAIDFGETRIDKNDASRTSIAQSQRVIDRAGLKAAFNTMTRRFLPELEEPLILQDARYGAAIVTLTLANDAISM